jgi:cyclomaltodextrinase / maltogenic alpha-amylase / neopullulanase
MLQEAIYHSNDMPYVFPVNKYEIKLRIRSSRKDQAICRILVADRYVSPGEEIPLPMPRCATTRHHDYFECTVRTETKRLRYQFLLEDKYGEQVWYGECGASKDRQTAGFFQFPYISEVDIPKIPDWLMHAVVYQIFPDRFNRDSTKPAETGLSDWSDLAPNSQSLYGGDLRGIIEKLPYLADLGINTIYLNPIFISPSNHKYDTSDYYTIDPAFGNKDTLLQLVEIAHAHNIRVLLDAVFNHTGDHFFAFQDLLKHGEQSEYRDWYMVDEFPVVQSPSVNYETFGTNIGTMPKLNTANPDVVRYFVDVALYWLETAGIDGWRLDVANEVDHHFWRELRKAVKSRFPDAALLGEIMHDSGPWLRGDQFDGVMNYTWREAVLDFFARQTIGVCAFAEQIELNRMSYTDVAMHGMMQLLDSHDTERFLTTCINSRWGWQAIDSAVQRMMLAVSFQLTIPGMPTIYYGDEMGMTGASDPDCRQPMVWESELQNRKLQTFYRQLIRIRLEHDTLRLGDFRIVFTDEASNVIGYTRTYQGETITIVLNQSPASYKLATANLKSNRSGTIMDYLTASSWTVDQHTCIDIPAYGVVILG